MRLVYLVIFCMCYSVISQAQEWTKDQSNWVEITSDMGFHLDLRYATENNFVSAQMYDCPRCFVRPDVFVQLQKANKRFAKFGYRIAFFDCYRPLDVQWELWEKVPDPLYVADPRKGSMHNRGVAVDITLVDSTGTALDMGTAFDFFGWEAYHSSTPDLSEEIQRNRTLLKETMEEVGFSSIRTEWWHYNYNSTRKWPIFESKWACPAKDN